MDLGLQGLALASQIPFALGGRLVIVDSKDKYLLDLLVWILKTSFA